MIKTVSENVTADLAAAESRARAAEADCAAMREALVLVVGDGKGWEDGNGRNIDAVLGAALAPHPGAPLLAELEAARNLVNYARHDSDCGAPAGLDCSCGLDVNRSAYDRARGAR